MKKPNKKISSKKDLIKKLDSIGITSPYIVMSPNSGFIMGGTMEDFYILLLAAAEGSIEFKMCLMIAAGEIAKEKLEFPKKIHSKPKRTKK